MTSTTLGRQKRLSETGVPLDLVNQGTRVALVVEVDHVARDVRADKGDLIATQSAPKTGPVSVSVAGRVATGDGVPL